MKFMSWVLYSQQVLAFVAQKDSRNGESFSAAACTVPGSSDCLTVWGSIVQHVTHAEGETRRVVTHTKLREAFGLNARGKMRNIVNTVKYNANRIAEQSNKTMTLSPRELGERVYFSWLSTGVSVLFHISFPDSFPLALNSWLAYFFVAEKTTLFWI